MNRHALAWLAIAAPLVIGVALLIPNADAIGIAWNASRGMPFNKDYPLEQIKAFRAAFSGRANAKADIRAGHLALKAWGMPSPASVTYDKLMKKRLGVEIKVVAGCVVWPSQEAGWNSYNQLMLGEIRRRFGPHAVEDVWKEAQRTPDDCGGSSITWATRCGQYHVSIGRAFTATLGTDVYAYDGHTLMVTHAGSAPQPIAIADSPMRPPAR